MSEFVVNSFDLQKCKYWALLNGIVVSNTTNDDSTVHAPFALYPYKYPIAAFTEAQNIAPVFNSLVHKVSRDAKWLIETLDNTAKNDPFTGRMMDIFKQVLSEGERQSITLGLHRSDYMLHNVASDSRALMQVELNTIAASFGSLSSKVAEMHRNIYHDHGMSIPPNSAHHQFADGIAEAHRMYIAQRGGAVAASVMMIVQPGEKNVADQWLLQFALLERHGVMCVRHSLAEVEAKGHLNTEHVLSVDGQEISVVYFRAGYTPTDYPSENEWTARQRIESSCAVKCPNIAYHLVGTKKVQQALASPGVLERFVSAEETFQLRRVFAGLFSLDPSDSSAEAVAQVKKSARAEPHKYVMKPQREGGGNNLYGEDIVTALDTMSDLEMTSYIMMERILPPSQSAVLVRRSHAVQATCICELGVYSVFLQGNSDSTSQPAINSYAGYLLRVKAETENEGGVATGYSVLGSIDLS